MHCKACDAGMRNVDKELCTRCEQAALSSLPREIALLAMQRERAQRNMARFGVPHVEV